MFYVPVTRWQKTRSIKQKYRKNLKRDLNLRNPETLSDKVQWLKLNYHDERMTIAADKIAVREMVAEKIGKEYLVPIVGIYENAHDIDWEKLPKKFVAKVNNGYNANIVCTDKSKLDKQETIKRLNMWLQPEQSHYWKNYERQYKDIPPRIIIERYIGDASNVIHEYKFMYVGDKLTFIMVPTDRSVEDSSKFNVAYYDSKWKKMSIRRKGHNFPKNEVSRPNQLGKMLDIAKTLAKGFPVCRVDLYEHNNKIMFGELTLTPANGLYKLAPSSWDKKLGDMLVLPKRNNFTLVEWRPIGAGSTGNK